MRIFEPDYDAFAEDHFPNLKLVRAWRDCRIWEAGIEQLLLVLVDDDCKCVAVFEFDTLAERERGIQLVRNLADGDDGETTGVPAFPGPTPPMRSASNAQTIPKHKHQDSRQLGYYSGPTARSISF